MACEQNPRGTAVVRAANRYFDSMEPWKLKKSDPDRMGDVLAVSLETLRCIAIGEQHNNFGARVGGARHPVAEVLPGEEIDDGLPR